MTVADQTPDVIMFTDDRDRTNEFHHIVTTCATRRDDLFEVLSHRNQDDLIKIEEQKIFTEDARKIHIRLLEIICKLQRLESAQVLLSNGNSLNNDLQSAVFEIHDFDGNLKRFREKFDGKSRSFRTHFKSVVDILQSKAEIISNKLERMIVIRIRNLKQQKLSLQKRIDAVDITSPPGGDNPLILIIKSNIHGTNDWKEIELEILLNFVQLNRMMQQQVEWLYHQKCDTIDTYVNIKDKINQCIRYFRILPPAQLFWLAGLIICFLISIMLLI